MCLPNYQTFITAAARQLALVGITLSLSSGVLLASYSRASPLLFFASSSSSEFDSKGSKDEELVMSRSLSTRSSYTGGGGSKMDIIVSQAATTHPHNDPFISTSNNCTPKDTVVDQKVDDIETQNDDSQIESQNQSHQAVATTQKNNNPFFSAFKGCSKWLLIIVLVASALLAVGSSCLLILLMERSINAVENSSSSDIHDFVTNTLFRYAAFGALFIFCWIRYWTVIGEAQSARMRDQLYQKLATLKQGESFDHKVNNIKTIEDLERNFRYMTLIRDATGVKAGIFIFLMCNFIISYIIALTRAPLLTLSVFIPCVILLAIFHYIKVVIKSRMDSQEQEAIPSIKTDSTLSMLQKLCKYVENEAVLEGGINGLCELILVSCAELQLWQGNKMGYSSTEAIVTIQCTVIGLKSLCLALPYWSTFSAGRDAANKMSEIIKSEQLREDQGQIDEQGSQSLINRKSSGIGSSTTSLNSDYASSDVSSRFSEPESTPSPPPPPTESKSLHNDIPKRSLRWRAYDLNIQERYYTITGMILSVAIGAITPVFNLMLASKILDFYTPDQNQQLWKFLCLLGVLSLFIHPLRTHCFTKSGLELTNRTRSMILKKVATLKINGFQSGVTVASLYTDAALMKVLVGDDLSFHSQNVGSALASCVITGILNWKLALTIFIFYIVLGVIWILQCKCMFKLRTHAKNEQEKAKQVASIPLESMINDVENVMEEHRSKCEGLETIGRRDVLISSVGCGLIVFIFFTMLAIIFRHAVVGHIKEEKSQAPRILFSLFLGVAMVMVGLVVSASYPFDITKAEAAAGSVFAFLDGEYENELVDKGLGMNLSINDNRDIEFGGGDDDDDR